MASPQPLLIRADKRDFLLPHWNDTSGRIRIPAGGSFFVHCSSGLKNFRDGEVREMRVTCMGGKYYRSDDDGGPDKLRLKNLRCQKQNWITLWPVPGNHSRDYCLNDSIADIGYRGGADNALLKTMSICHSVDNLATHYTIYQMRPFSSGYQKGVGRPSFIQPREYNYTVKMSQVYSKENQRKMIDKILAEDEDLDDYFDDEKFFLSRGHLGGKADFYDANHQRSTFFYLNTAPQFQAINGGNWLRVEDGIRRFVAKERFNATIISGTLGVLRFPGLADGQLLYLGRKGTVPVPQYFYKLVYNAVNQRGIVFVSINNPHLEDDEVDEYLFCEDIVDKVKWVSLRNDNTAGVIFACEVGEFLKEIKSGLLPPLNVTGVLL